MAKGPLIVGALAAGGILLWALSRAKAETPPGGVSWEQCLSDQAPRWMTPDEAMTFCDLAGDARQRYLDERRQAYCDANWRDDPDSCYQWTEEYQEWTEELRPAPGTVSFEVDEETRARLQAQWDERESAIAAERQATHEDVWGVLAEVDALVEQIRFDGIPDMDQRRARLVSAGLIIDQRARLADATIDGIERWESSGILHRTEAIKDWLSLRRETQYGNYSLADRYAEVTSCLGVPGGAQFCADERARIESLSLQYPRFEAFFSTWRMAPTVPIAPSIFPGQLITRPISVARKS